MPQTQTTDSQASHAPRLRAENHRASGPNREPRTRCAAVDAVAVLAVTRPTLQRVEAAITALSRTPTRSPEARHAARALLTDLHGLRAKLQQQAALPVVRLCPHCLAALEARDPRSATRCEICRLLVGAGRSLTPDDASALTRCTQAGAVALAARVRREALGRAGDPDIAARDIRRVAASLEVPADRLRMIDYEAARATDLSLMELRDIVGTFESWKRARRLAHAQLHEKEDEPALAKARSA